LLTSDSDAGRGRFSRSAGLLRNSIISAIRASVTACGAVPLVIAANLPALAADGEVRAKYEATLAGLTIAYADVVLAIRGNTYSVRTSYRTSGTARLMSSATGEAVSSGTYNSGSLVPATFDLDHRGSQRVQKVALVMSAGTVDKLTIDPPVDQASQQAPIEPAHLKNIVDPLSALLASGVRVDGTSEVGVCDRTVPVFDGVRRFDLALKRKERPAATPGPFKGPLTACELRLTPVAGEVRSSQAGMPNRALGATEMTFGFLDAQKIYIPVSLSAKLGFATLQARLTQFAHSASRQKRITSNRSGYELHRRRRWPAIVDKIAVSSATGTPCSRRPTRGAEGVISSGMATLGAVVQVAAEVVLSDHAQSARVAR